MPGPLADNSASESVTSSAIPVDEESTFPDSDTKIETLLALDAVIPVDEESTLLDSDTEIETVLALDAVDETGREIDSSETTRNIAPTLPHLDVPPEPAIDEVDTLTDVEAPSDVGSTSMNGNERATIKAPSTPLDPARPYGNPISLGRMLVAKSKTMLVLSMNFWSSEHKKMTSSPVSGRMESPDGTSIDAVKTDGAAPEQAPTVPPAPRRKRKHRVLSIVLLLLLLLGILVPVGVAIGTGVNAYRTYNTLRDQARSGIQHLLNVKTIFNGVKSHPSGFFDTHKLQLAQNELLAAQKDFQQLHYSIDHTSVIHALVSYFPQYGPQVTTARASSQIGMDVAVIGERLIATALILAPRFHGSLLSASSNPLVTQDVLDLLHTTISAILPPLDDIQMQSPLLSLDALPINAQQREQLVQLLQALPQAKSDLQQVQGLLDGAGWLLGVDAQRIFLVQTMDRAELRPTGGFTGQYGELYISAGRVAPFSLRDISLLEYVPTSRTLGQLSPEEYRSWWPFANWGLRDSNLSADFPLSAQIAINEYEHEAGKRVDGVVLFTPFLMEHILQIIGPIQVPGYNDTITALNLEERLHYYQQDNAGIYKQIHIQPADTSTSDRKRFTALLARLMMDQVRHAPPDELIAIGRQLLHDLKTRDLQVYVANPEIESLLQRYGDAGEIDRSATHDGLYVVQANISASKASQYVRTSIHDVVTLDRNGGATHVMQMKLIYNQLGPVYGYDTYRDYVRIYVPPSSHFLWGNGFDTGIPLCGGGYPACPERGVYPNDELVCPTNLYQPGAMAPTLTDEDGGRWRPLDTIGPPTNLTSDESGRAMFGGLIVVPKNCTMTVTLSWYVPPMGQQPYALLVQRQAGTFPELDLTILPTPGNCHALQTSGMHFDGILPEDTSFALPVSSSIRQGMGKCYPQSRV